MSIFDKAGGVILFACAIPLLLLEEARALTSVKDDLAAAREGWRRAEGERDEARRVRDMAARGCASAQQERDRIAVEMSGREVMVSDAKREARGLSHQLKGATEDAASLRLALAEAQRAAVELQAEVDRARTERDVHAYTIAKRDSMLAEQQEKIDQADETIRTLQKTIADLRALIAEAQQTIAAELPSCVGFALMPSVAAMVALFKDDLPL